ncbi:MAG: hypothetical protein ACOYIJ_02525 [Eubacteriales bacterium]
MLKVFIYHFISCSRRGGIQLRRRHHQCDNKKKRVPEKCKK